MLVREARRVPPNANTQWLRALIKHGWQVKSFSGGEGVVHLKYPDLINVSIAAAALKQFRADGIRRFYQPD
jgi:hypothetical protein